MAGVRREAGQSLAEFALAIPIFVLLLFGLFDVGRLVYVNNAISQAAREGARYGSVQNRAQTAATRIGIHDYTVGVMAAIPNPTVTVSCESEGSPSATCRSQDQLVVTVSSPVEMLTPVIGQIVGTVTVSSTAKVTVNQ